MGKLEGEKKALEGKIDELKSKLEEEQKKPWWKKLFGG